MKRTMTTLCLALILCLTGFGCQTTPTIPNNPVPVQWGVPERPDLLPVKWSKGGPFCLDETNAANLRVNIQRLRTHIEVLEIQIRAMERAINGGRE